MNGKQFRQVSRLIHLVGSGVIGTYIYSPWSADPVFAAIVQFVTVPVLVLTGVAMWQQGRIVKWLQNKPSLR